VIDKAHPPRPESDANDPLGLVSGSEGAITGTVVCAAAIAYGVGHLDTIGQLSTAILGTVFVYWLAHLHAVTLANSLDHGHHPFVAFRHAVAETFPILVASVFPLALLLATTLFGASPRTAATIALYATVGLLGLYSYIAGVRSGVGTVGRIASTAGGIGIGLLVVLLKVALH
jgi:hypothetical protein